MIKIIAAQDSVYVAAIKYEISRATGVGKICRAIDPNDRVSESIAWNWFEKNQNNEKAIKEMLKKIGYKI
jgi:hypothetical protein